MIDDDMMFGANDENLINRSGAARGTSSNQSSGNKA